MTQFFKLIDRCPNNTTVFIFKYMNELEQKLKEFKISNRRIAVIMAMVGDIAHDNWYKAKEKYKPIDK